MATLLVTQVVTAFIGPDLEALMAKSPLSYADLASWALLKRHEIFEVRDNTRPVTIDEAILIARALHVDVATLTAGTITQDMLDMNAAQKHTFKLASNYGPTYLPD